VRVGFDESRSNIPLMINFHSVVSPRFFILKNADHRGSRRCRLEARKERVSLDRVRRSSWEPPSPWLRLGQSRPLPDLTPRRKANRSAPGEPAIRLRLRRRPPARPPTAPPLTPTPRPRIRPASRPPMFRPALAPRTPLRRQPTDRPPRIRPIRVRRSRISRRDATSPTPAESAPSSSAAPAKLENRYPGRFFVRDTDR
jgi:hypothetical protein